MGGHKRVWELSYGRSTSFQMNGENQPLVTDELVDLRIHRLKFKTSGKLPISLKESMEYYTSH